MISSAKALKFSFLLTVFVFATFSSSAAFGENPKEWVDTNLPPLIKLYIHFHRNPELSFEEKETAARLAEELKNVGAEVTVNVGGYGVVGILDNGNGPTVMVRTDLDALPVVEQTNLPYASTKKVNDADGKTVGVMHACGHDVHMTTLIGVARYFASHKDLWSGRLMFIGQPAEERGAGAKAMLDDGLFEKFKKPDYALALHCSPVVPTGCVALRGGFAMANVDSVDIKLYGRGGHGAYPHTTIDPIVEAAKLILDLQTIVSREVKPIEPAVVTVGSIHAGTKHNIISDECDLQLTVRSYSDEVREQIIEAIKRKAKAAAMSVGAKDPVVTVSEGIPALSNNEKVANRMTTAFRAALGEKQVLEAEQVMGAEDFSLFGRAGVPSLMFFLGVVDQKRLDRYKEMGISPPSMHSNNFYPDIDKALETGVVSMCNAILELNSK